MSNQLLEKYIKDQVVYFNEIDYLFESIINKNSRVDENFLKNVKKFFSNTTPLEKILILAIATTGILGKKIVNNVKIDDKDKKAVSAIVNNIKNDDIPKSVEKSFSDRINKNDFNRQLTFEERNAIKTIFGIEDKDVNQENLENPLVLLFQELLSNSENISDDDREDMILNKDAIESDLGIDKFDNLEKWSESVLLGNNDDVIGLFRQPLKLNQTQDENDLFSQIGIYEVDPSEKIRIKESIQEKINFLRIQGASEKIINLMTALGTLKINGSLDGSDISSDLIKRSKSLLETEDMQEVLSKYISNTASAFTEFDDSNY